MCAFRHYNKDDLRCYKAISSYIAYSREVSGEIVPRRNRNLEKRTIKLPGMFSCADLDFFFSRKKGGLRDIKVCQEWGGGDGGGDGGGGPSHIHIWLFYHGSLKSLSFSGVGEGAYLNNKDV